MKPHFVTKHLFFIKKKKNNKQTNKTKKTMIQKWK